VTGIEIWHASHALKNIRFRLKLETLTAIPVEFAPIPISVAVVAAQISALEVRGGVVAAVIVAVQIATGFVAILRYPGVIASCVAWHIFAAIKSKRRRHSHSH
jgi:hypothetical protein